MPTHVYKPAHDPPSWWDRLLVHPMDTAVAVVSLLFGAVVALALFLPEFIPSKSMGEMPDPVVALVAGFLIAGGALVLTGLNWMGDEVSHGWALERFGWLLTAGGFATYSVSVLSEFPGSVFAWGVPLALALGGILRFCSIVKIEKTTRITIAEVKGEVE